MQKPGAPEFQGLFLLTELPKYGHPYLEDLFTEERGYLATVDNAVWESRVHCHVHCPN